MIAAAPRKKPVTAAQNAVRGLFWSQRRYHESINNLTPADVYFGRGQSILKQRERIRRKTMETRRLQHRKYAA
jgi:hypothetical protein